MWMGRLEASLAQCFIGGVLCNSYGDVSITFSNPIGVKDSNEEGVLAILGQWEFILVLFKIG